MTELDYVAETLREGADRMDGDLRELRELSPQRFGKTLCWLTRRGRWLLISLTNNKSGPVIGVSIWVETNHGERFPVRDATYELPTYQLPVLARAVAKAIALCQASIGDRLDARRDTQAGGAQRQGGAR